MRSFKHLPVESVQAELSRLDIGAAQLTHIGGYLGRNDLFFVDAAGGLPLADEGVLKIFYDDNAAAKWAREKAAYGLARELGEAIPRLLDSGRFGEPGDEVGDEVGDEAGAPWLLIERKHGFLWEGMRASLTRADELRLYEQAGALLGRLHQLRPVTAVPGLPRGACASFYRRRAARVFGRALPDQDLFVAAKRRLVSLEALFDPRSFGACFVHRDFSPRNLLIDGAPGEAHVLALIDFERAQLGDPVEDFAMFVFKELMDDAERADAFFAGYLAHSPLPERFDQRLAYHLIGLFLEIGGWAYEDDRAYYEQAVAALRLVLAGDPRLRFSRRLPQMAAQAAARRAPAL